MKNIVKLILIIFSGFLFYLITGDISNGLLMIILLSYFELKKPKDL